MKNYGKFNILGINLSACDYDYILNQIERNVKNKKNLLLSPLASQTFTLAFFNDKLRKILNSYKYLVPDSQWVRKSLDFLYGIKLADRVYGPELMLKVCNLSEKNKYNLFFYGTTGKTLLKLQKKLKKLFPNIKISGSLSSKFRSLTLEEKNNIINQVKKTKSHILLIALGSPLEQIVSYDFYQIALKSKTKITIIPFGAAFDFIAGVKPQSPKWIGKIGFEWLFRFLSEPRRLWKRYLIYSTAFLILVLRQKLEKRAIKNLL